MQQMVSRKFLDTLEDVLTSSRTSPVVRERLMDVLAAVAYASQNSTHRVSLQTLQTFPFHIRCFLVSILLEAFKNY